MERRLTAILAADVAGYSLLMNVDEEGTYAAWRSARVEVVDPCIAEYGGRIVKHTGDGFLAEFPTVLAAVQCGVSVQKEMARRNADVSAEKRLQFRIGINLGDIIVDQEDIHGDGVNIAARLESIADPGGLCISGDVHNQVRNKLNLHFRDMGERSVKNIHTPVRVYSVAVGDGHRVELASSVEGESSPVPPDRVETDEDRLLSMDGDIAFRRMLDDVVALGQRSAALVVGRAHERAVLRRAFDDAQAKRGNLVLMRGEPGIGKTSLVYAFADEAKAAGALVVHGHCHETLGSPPFWPWLQIFKGLETFAGSEESSSTNIFESVAASQTDWRAGSTSMFANPGGVEQFVLFSRIANCISRFALDRTLVIVLDDLHWADKSSLLLLTHLCERLSEHSIMVVGTYRDHEITRKHPLFLALADIGREATVHRVALKGLSEDEVSAVIERTVNQSLPDMLLKAVYEKTEGNPLFVSEVARILQQDMNSFARGPIVVEIPEGIQEAIGRRLNQLSNSCNDLLSVASVIGRSFSLRALTGVLVERDQIDVLKTLEEAVRAGVVEEHGKDFRFSHVLIRDILYDELSLVKRLVLHRNVADTLAQLRGEGFDYSLGEIARHYYKATQGGQAHEAVEYAIRAAEHAARYCAHDEAIGYYQLALEALSLDEASHEDKKAATYLALSISMRHSDVPIEETLYTLQRCLEIAREHGQQDVFAEAACWFVYVGRHSAHAPRGLAVIQEALSYLREEDRLLRAKVLAHLGAALTHNHRRREAEQYARDAISTAAASGDKVAQCHALSMAILVLRTRPEKLSERIRLGEQALALAAEADNGFFLEEALEWHLLSHQESGNIERVRQLVRDLESTADRFQFQTARYFVAWTKAYLALLEGRWNDAQTLVDQAAEVGAGTLDGGSEGVYGAQMFLLNRELGRLPMVRSALQQMIADGKRRMWMPGLLATYTELGLMDDARKIFEELVADEFRLVVQDELYPICLVYLTEACAELGDGESARSLYQRLMPFSGQMLSHPTAACYGPADLYLGMLASLMNDFAEAQNLFDRARGLCERAGRNIWSAHTEYRHARALKSHNFPGGRSAFVEKLNESRSLAQSMGMVNLLSKLDKLEDEGSAEKQVNTEKLTRRELEVLHLVVQGKSNKQIAAELNRSLATVATHVRSILTKTNTDNRTAAAGYARERELFTARSPRKATQG